MRLCLIRFAFSLLPLLPFPPGTSPQSLSNFNAPSAVCRAAVMYVFRTLVDSEIPMNEGCLNAIEIRIPERSMLAPEYPAAVVAGNVETSQVY